MSNDEELNKILKRKYEELTRPAEVSHLTKNNFDEFIKEHEAVSYTHLTLPTNREV